MAASLSIRLNHSFSKGNGNSETPSEVSSNKRSWAASQFKLENNTRLQNIRLYIQKGIGIFKVDMSTLPKRIRKFPDIPAHTVGLFGNISQDSNWIRTPVSPEGQILVPFSHFDCWCPRPYCITQKLTLQIFCFMVVEHLVF